MKLWFGKFYFNFPLAFVQFCTMQFIFCVFAIGYTAKINESHVQSIRHTNKCLETSQSIAEL